MANAIARPLLLLIFVLTSTSAFASELLSANEMFNAIAVNGKLTLYNIYFDRKKADIRPESRPAINEIAVLLRKKPNLQLYIVSHTDNDGELDFNMTLSKHRAMAVAGALIEQYGIEPYRLAPYGVGPLAPVAGNDTEAGRSRNRRIELIPR